MKYGRGSSTDLLDHADRALYVAKRTGKGGWSVHDGQPGLTKIVA